MPIRRFVVGPQPVPLLFVGCAARTVGFEKPRFCAWGTPYLSIRRASGVASGLSSGSR